MKQLENKSIHYVPKGWGYEKWIANSELYCGKLLFIKKGKKTSWHYHEIKDEVMFVQSGEVEILYSDSKKIEEAKRIIITKGQAFHVYTGLVHRIIALEDTELFEFSTQHFDSDSIRIERGD